MNSYKKRFSMGWFMGLVLGIASSAAVVYAAAVNITSFSSGTAISSSAVNTNFSNLKSAVENPGSACVGNTGEEVVQVGPLCVDKHRARADFTGCAPDGTGAGCATVKARSISTGTEASGMSWAQAQRACINAGKRLLTPGEWLAAFISNQAPSMNTVDNMDFVDAFQPLTTLGGNTAPAQAGYIGPRAVASNKVQFVTNVDYDAGGFGIFLGFRCVR